MGSPLDLTVNDYTQKPMDTIRFINETNKSIDERFAPAGRQLEIMSNYHSVESSQDMYSMRQNR